MIKISVGGCVHVHMHVYAYVFALDVASQNAQKYLRLAGAKKNCKLFCFHSAWKSK